MMKGMKQSYRRMESSCVVIMVMNDMMQRTYLHTRLWIWWHFPMRLTIMVCHGKEKRDRKISNDFFAFYVPICNSPISISTLLDLVSRDCKLCDYCSISPTIFILPSMAPRGRKPRSSGVGPS